MLKCDVKQKIEIFLKKKIEPLFYHIFNALSRYFLKKE
jgi:hypothetical protein